MINQQSDTPRTDAFYDGPEDKCPPAEHARMLERKLNEAINLIEQYYSCNDSVVNACVMFPNVSEYIKHVDNELDQLRAENERLKLEIKTFKDAQIKNPLNQSDSVALNWMNKALNLEQQLTAFRKDHMNTQPADTELKQLLAKMFPDSLFYGVATLTLYWHYKNKDNRKGGDAVLDTELLHICREIEKGLSADDFYSYDELLSSVLRKPQTIHATWQQRATALAKVKGLI